MCHPLLSGTVIDTMRNPWVARDVGKQPKFATLCEHLGVPIEASKHHDATYDTQTLAQCLQAARERGLVWTVKEAPSKRSKPGWYGMEHRESWLDEHYPRRDVREAMETPM